MNRTDRLSAILIQLQSKRVVKAHEIADRFGISIRTAYRDIRALEEAGVPIGAEAGVGYYILDSYHLPPVMFTTDEASALLFGEKLVEKMSDDKTRNDFCSALYKIKAILRQGEKDYLEKLHDRIVVLNHYSTNDCNHELFISEIRQALANKQALEINYEPRYAEKAFAREVEPIGLCNYNSRWHLIAWCCLRNDYRDFRLDRIESLKPSDKNFIGKQHISVKEYLKSIATFTDKPNISLVIETDKKKYIDESKYWYGFLKEQKTDSGYRIEFSNTELYGFANWLLSSGSFPTIEKPEELKRIISSYVKSAADFYL
jgi:predicted DNA-binding transcriptional regulator YafY